METQLDIDNRHYETLSALASALPNWLRVDRDAAIERVITNVLETYREMPSPDAIEGIETGLDFLGLLLTEGGDNGLYEFTMEQLGREIYHAVRELSDDEIVALLLPMEQSDIKDLFTDRDIIEWPYFLLAGAFWQEEMLNLLLNQVEPKDRYDSVEEAENN